MATKSSKSLTARLRKVWFQVHKWIGIILAIAIIPLCLSGSALVWDEGLTEVTNPQRGAEGAVSLDAGTYANAARAALTGGEILTQLSYPEGGNGAVVASGIKPAQSGGGRPQLTQVWLDPVDAHVLDQGSGGSDFLRTMHLLHGSLMIPGMGRTIVGWLGVFMLISSLTGLWLWWPFKGGFARGLRWKRMPTTSGNLHHQGGFWIAIPLAILSLTGAWIAFPAFFGALTGDTPGGPGPEGRRGPSAPLEQVAMSPDAALAAARPLAQGELRSIGWPSAPDGEWSLIFGEDRATYRVSDATGEVTLPEPAAPEPTSRLVRRIHDGNEMGLLWQIVIFLGGIIPAALAVTGIMMWLRGRRIKGSVRAAFAAEQAS